MTARSGVARYAGNVGQELTNGEHKAEWPESDRPLSADDSDAPVIGDVGSGDVGSQEDADSAADVSGAENVDIRNGGARDIDATTVSITQGGARDIDATTVTINQGGAANVRAEQVTVSQGGIAFARGDNVTLQQGGSAFAVIADQADLDPESSVFLLVAGTTNGDVRPVVDWRAAAAFGAAFAFVLGVLRRARR
jgi:hypothetical protein